MVQKPRARKARLAKQPGDNPTKNGWTNPKKDAEKKFYGELSLYVKDYRDLPVDDPLRVHIESRYSNAGRQRDSV